MQLNRSPLLVVFPSLGSRQAGGFLSLGFCGKSCSPWVFRKCPCAQGLRPAVGCEDFSLNVGSALRTAPGETLAEGGDSRSRASWLCFLLCLQPS